MFYSCVGHKHCIKANNLLTKCLPVLCANEKPIWTVWIIILYVFNPIMWQSFVVIGLSWMGRLIPHTHRRSLGLLYGFHSCPPVWSIVISPPKGPASARYRKQTQYISSHYTCFCFKLPLHLELRCYFTSFIDPQSRTLAFAWPLNRVFRRLCFPSRWNQTMNLKYRGHGVRGCMVLWHSQSSASVAYVTDRPQHGD